MNVNLWGPSFWIVLHGLAKLYDKDYSDHPETAKDPDELVRDLQYILPCPTCRDHFADIYASMEKPIRGTLSFWMYRAHSKVLITQWKGSLETLQHKTQISNDVKFLLVHQAETLIKQPSFSAVQKKLAFHYNDLIPTREFATLLVCLFRVHDEKTIQLYVKPWLARIGYFGFSGTLSEILEASDPYSRAIVYKYGDDTPALRAMLDDVLL